MNKEPETIAFDDLPDDHPLNTGIGIISMSNLEPICQDDNTPLSFVEIDKLACTYNFEVPAVLGEPLSKREKRIIRRWHVTHSAYKVRRNMKRIAREIAKLTHE